MTDATRPNTIPWPPLIYYPAIVISAVLGAIYPLPFAPRPISDMLLALGALLVLGGAVIFIAAARTLRQAKTTIRPDKASDHLVVTGPFAFTRNPIYVAFTMVMVGLGLATANLWFLALAVLASALTSKLAIEREEKHLEARFGKKYRDYSKRVRRWL